MNAGDLITIQWKIRSMAQGISVGPDAYLYDKSMVAEKPILNIEIVTFIKKIIRDIHNLLSNVDDKEAVNLAMYVAFQELPSKNKFMEDYMKEFGSVDRFMSYFRSSLSNPFC